MSLPVLILAASLSGQCYSESYSAPATSCYSESYSAPATSCYSEQRVVSASCYSEQRAATTRVTTRVVSRRQAYTAEEPASLEVLPTAQIESIPVIRMPYRATQAPVIVRSYAAPIMMAPAVQYSPVYASQPRRLFGGFGFGGGGCPGGVCR